MPSEPGHRRRTVLAVGAAALATLAGCGTDPTGDAVPTGPDAATGARTPTDGSVPSTAETGSADGQTGRSGAVGTTGTSATGADTETPELDLREANVVGVEFESGDGTYDFHVTLYHDDDGEDGYADWWQVESLARDRLGRRTLLHAHSTAPFTRSETIDVPGGTTCVVVRGHDQTHDYGGQAMLVNLETGATRGVDQGPAPRAFEGGDCP